MHSDTKKSNELTRKRCVRLYLKSYNYFLTIFTMYLVRYILFIMGIYKNTLCVRFEAISR